MFADLNEKLSGVFKRLKGEARLSDSNIQDAVKAVRMALLEADVNFKVVKEFIAKVQNDSIGLDVSKNISPTQQFIKIINDNLIDILGGKDYSPSIPLSSKPPTKIMLVGLQGSGKTTTAGKLANYYTKQNKNTLMVACDIYRAAAITQLQVIGKNLSIDVFADMENNDVTSIADKGLEFALRSAKDIVIFDTAGRLHIDENLMSELQSVKSKIKPDYIFFVADSLTGQDAVNSAKEFDNKLDISGVILTKTDGDARGGAALSIKYATGKPIVFLGIGERYDEFELFHPDRVAGRILGMGDIVSLVEKAEDAFEKDEAETLAKKVKTGLDFNDLLKQFNMMKKMSLEGIMKMIPGLGSKLPSVNLEDNKLKRIESIIFSMTLQERNNPDILNSSRKKRISAGAGVNVSELNKLIDQLNNMNKMMKKFGRNLQGKSQADSMKEIGKLFSNIR